MQLGVCTTGVAALEAARKRVAAMEKEIEERKERKREKIEAARAKFAGATEATFREKFEMIDKFSSSKSQKAM